MAADTSLWVTPVSRCGCGDAGWLLGDIPSFD
jgi:hypothetical protein